MEQDSHCSERKAEHDGRADAFIASLLSKTSIAHSTSKHASHCSKQTGLGSYPVNDNLPTLVNWEGVGGGQHGPLLGGWA